MHLAPLRAAALLGTVLLLACTLVSNPDPLQAGCDQEAKACVLFDGELGCVDRDDPEFGCASASCVACTLPSAAETCDAEGRCAVATCDRGRGNCNGNAADGCEANLEENYDHCTTCGHSCGDDLRTMPHTASVRCRVSRCQVDDCEPGYADCDHAASNGCEVELELEQCGQCEGCAPGSVCNIETQECE
jgi:hypothetical protein